MRESSLLRGSDLTRTPMPQCGCCQGGDPPNIRRGGFSSCNDLASSTARPEGWETKPTLHQASSIEVRERLEEPGTRAGFWVVGRGSEVPHVDQTDVANLVPTKSPQRHLPQNHSSPPSLHSLPVSVLLTRSPRATYYVPMPQPPPRFRTGRSSPHSTTPLRPKQTQAPCQFFSYHNPPTALVHLTTTPASVGWRRACATPVPAALQPMCAFPFGVPCSQLASPGFANCSPRVRLENRNAAQVAYINPNLQQGSPRLPRGYEAGEKVRTLLLGGCCNRAGYSPQADDQTTQRPTLLSCAAVQIWTAHEERTVERGSPRPYAVLPARIVGGRALCLVRGDASLFLCQLRRLEATVRPARTRSPRTRRVGQKTDRQRGACGPWLAVVKWMLVRWWVERSAWRLGMPGI